jgi:hypothetical protein
MGILNLITSLLPDYDETYHTDSEGRRLSTQEIVDAYNELYGQAQELQAQYNELCEEYDNLLELHDQLCDEYDKLVGL